MSITIKNFKSYLDSGAIDIKPITFVFGRNSSGKSALIQALALAGQMDKLFKPPAFSRGNFLNKFEQADARGGNRSIPSDLSFNEENLQLTSFEQTVHKKDIASSFEFVLDRQLSFGNDTEPTDYQLNIEIKDPGNLTSLTTSLEKLDLMLPIQESFRDEESNEVKSFLATLKQKDLSLENLEIRAHRITDISIELDPLATADDIWFEIESKSIRSVMNALEKKGITDFSKTNFRKKYVFPLIQASAIYRATKKKDGTFVVEAPPTSMILRRSGDRENGMTEDGKQIEFLADSASKYLLPDILGRIVYDSIRSFTFVTSCKHIRAFRGDPFVSTLQTNQYNPSMDALLDNNDLLRSISKNLQSMGLEYKLLANTKKLPVYGDVKYLFLEEKVGGKPVRLTLEDVGFGVSQVLPILIENQLNRNRLILLEEPESHLHPLMQGDLIEIIAREESRRRNQKSRSDKPRKWVIETHSEYMLRRVQKLIRLKKVPSSGVCVLFCEQRDGLSIIRELPLGKNGDLLEPWPNDFLESSLD